MKKLNNLVAKNARNFNKAAVHRDRKKDIKRGYNRKHKGSQGPYSFNCKKEITMKTIFIVIAILMSNAVMADDFSKKPCKGDNVSIVTSPLGGEYCVKQSPHNENYFAISPKSVNGLRAAFGAGYGRDHAAKIKLVVAELSGAAYVKGTCSKIHNNVTVICNFSKVK